jgi:two-component system cell cycle sensor histidine kinase/response regulator CckA
MVTYGSLTSAQVAEFLPNFIESVPFDCWAINRDGVCILQNRASVRRWGNQIGRRPEDLRMRGDTIERRIANFQRVFAGDTSAHEVNCEAGEENGRPLYFFEILMPIRDGDQIVGILGANINISGARMADRTRQEVEEKFRLLVEGSLDHAIVLLDTDGYVSSWNVGAERQRLCKTEDALGRHFSCFYLPADVAQGKPEFELVCAQREGVFVTEDWRQRSDGTRFRARMVLTALRDSSGKLHGFSEVTRDTSAEHEARQKLLESESRLTAILNTAHEAIITADAEERVLFFNPAAVQMFGCSAEKAIGLPLKNFLTRRSSDSSIGSDGVTGARSDGERFPAEASISQFETGGESLYSIIVRDVTKRLRAEEERREIQRKMQESQRLESLGVLAGGVAHDFNNLLTGILGNASLGRRSIRSYSPAQQYFQQIEQAATRAAELCQQMLAYSGKGHFMVMPLDFSSLVRDSAELLRASVSKKATLILDLPELLPPVMADMEQIRQLILNLVMNASESFGNGDGQIRISTGVLEACAQQLKGAVTSPSLAEGRYVWLEVQDSGCGISEETIEKIFDPFYSTKFTGRGLGLAAVHGIVRGHKGVLQVRSIVGKGSAFRFLLPATDETVEECAPEFKLTPEWRCSGPVLVVDDEETVRFVTSQMLELLGFDVVTAHDGTHALELFREDPDKWVFVLLDLTMPRLDGVDTHREIQRIRPDLRILIMSGFSEHEAVGRFFGARVAGFIHKPFRTATLLEKVQEVMEI